MHILLTKFIKEKKYRRKLIYALWGMCNQKSSRQKRYVSSRMYAIAKESYSKSISGANHWMKDPDRRKALSEKCKGRIISEETKKKISDTMKGRQCPWKDKIGQSNKGKTRTKEMCEAQSKRMKEASKNRQWISPTQNKNRPKTKCPYCGKLVDVANMKRWHNEFSNCKSRN